MACQDDCGIDNEVQRVLYAAKASLLGKHLCATFAYLKTFTGVQNKTTQTWIAAKPDIQIENQIKYQTPTIKHTGWMIGTQNVNMIFRRNRTGGNKSKSGQLIESKAFKPTGKSPEKLIL